MKLLSALTRFGVLVLGILLLSTVVGNEMWDDQSERELSTNDLGETLFLDWGLGLLAVGALLAMAMVGAAYLVRDERPENLNWEGGDLDD